MLFTSLLSSCDILASRPTHKIASGSDRQVFSGPAFSFLHPPTRPWVMTQTMLVSTVSLISISLHFMRDSLADLGAADDFRTGAVLAIEDVCMCLHAVIARLGRPLHLQSLHFVWSSCSKALATLETELFPGCEPSIPAEIDMPLVPRKLTTLMEPAWEHHRPLIGPAYNGLRRFRAWFCAFYDVALHHEVIDAVNDSMLLLAPIADICGVPIAQPVFLGSNSSLYSLSPAQS